MRGAAFRNWVAAPPHDFVVMPMALLEHGATTFNLRGINRKGSRSALWKALHKADYAKSLIM